MASKTSIEHLEAVSENANLAKWIRELSFTCHITRGRYTLEQAFESELRAPIYPKGAPMSPFEGQLQVLGARPH
jgi:hypothetical protein